MNCATCDSPIDPGRGVLIYDTAWPLEALHDPRLVHRECTHSCIGSGDMGRIDVRALDDKAIWEYLRRCATTQDRLAMQAIANHATGDTPSVVEEPEISDEEVPF